MPYNAFYAVGATPERVEASSQWREGSRPGSLNIAFRGVFRQLRRRYGLGRRVTTIAPGLNLETLGLTTTTSPAPLDPGTASDLCAKDYLPAGC